MGVRDMATARRSAGEAYVPMDGPATMAEVAWRARLAVWRFIHAPHIEVIRGYDFASQSAPRGRASDVAVAVRDMPTAHRSAGLLQAPMARSPTVAKAVMRARLAVWRFTHASRGEVAVVRFCAAKCPSRGRV